MKTLSIQDLSKTYADGVQALKSVSFDVEQADFFALLGPNGAGKSTLIGILTSLVRKTSGTVKIHGIDIDEDFEKAREYIGVVPQEFNFNLFDKVQNIVLNQAGFYGIPRSIAKERTEKYLRQLGLWDKRNAVSRTLSGGMKRRMMIARALVHNPKILILDEPTAGVDIEIRRSMWKFLQDINAQGVTIILTTHYLEEAENLCRNIAIIDHGRIIENTSMNALLAKLEAESFILYLEEELSSLPDIPEYDLKLINPSTIEAVLPKTQHVSALFDSLQKVGIRVSRLRNKANRLEELFIQLTQSEERPNEV